MKRTISKYTLKKATEHLYYEVIMFFQSLMFLTKTDSQLEVNLLLDSFTIHTRNLFDFFYPKQKSKKNPKGKLRKDDMFFFDYLDKHGNFRREKTKKIYFMSIVNKINKRTSHLTYTRNRYNSETELWLYGEIGKKMFKTIKAFYKELPSSYKTWPYIIKLKEVINSMDNFFNNLNHQ